MPCWLGVQLMSDVHAGSLHRRENHAESGQNTDNVFVDLVVRPFSLSYIALSGDFREAFNVAWSVSRLPRCVADSPFGR